MPHGGLKEAGQMPSGAVEKDIIFLVSLLTFILMKAYSCQTKFISQ